MEATVPLCCTARIIPASISVIQQQRANFHEQATVTLTVDVQITTDYPRGKGSGSIQCHTPNIKNNNLVSCERQGIESSLHPIHPLSKYEVPIFK